MQRKILVKGPALSRSGYGEQTRFALRALRSREDLFDIYIMNIPWGRTGQIISVKERSWLEKTIMKTMVYIQNQGAFDLSLQVTIPNEFEKIAPVDIGYTAGIETNKLAPEWLSKCNEMAKIITISAHSHKVLATTTYPARDAQGNEIPHYGISVPVDIVNYPVRLADPEPVDIDLTTKNNFLAISQWGPRKNLENTVKWFVEKFMDDEDAGLVLKCNTAADCLLDRGLTRGRLAALLREYPDKKCTVYLLHGGLSEGQLAWLYTHESMVSFRLN